MQYRLMAKTAQTRVPVHNLNLLSDDNITKDRKEREDGGHGRFAVDDEKGDVIDFQTVGEIADSGAAFVGMGDNDDFVAKVDEFGAELVDVRFDAAGLREEEIGDHGDVVRHFRRGWPFWVCTLVEGE